MNSAPPPTSYADPVLAALRELSRKVDDHADQSKTRHTQTGEQIDAVRRVAARAERAAEEASKKADLAATKAEEAKRLAGRVSLSGEGFEESILSEMNRIKAEVRSVVHEESKKDRANSRKWRGASAILLPALVVIAQRLLPTPTAPTPSTPESHSNAHENDQGPSFRPRISDGGTP